MKLSRYYASLIAALMLLSPLAAGSAEASQRVDESEGTVVQISADVYFQEGVKKFSRGDYQGAIADFNQAIRLNPNYAEAYNNRGVIVGCCRRGNRERGTGNSFVDILLPISLV